MSTKKSKYSPRLGSRTLQTTIHIPEALHELMKTLQQIRQNREGSQVRLSRLYREAVEAYVNAEPQQQLLREFSDGASRKTRAAGNRLAAGM